MKPVARALLIALIQAAIMIAVGGKLLYDRANLPRVWVETAGVDPQLPIRGRYVSLRLVVEPLNPPEEVTEPAPEAVPEDGPVAELPPRAMRGDAIPIPVSRIIAADGGLQVELRLDEHGEPDYRGTLGQTVVQEGDGAGRRWLLFQPVAFFLPEHAVDPTRLEPGQRLWAEVTVPDRGAPRPIRLEVR